MRITESIRFRRLILIVYWVVMFLGTHWPDIDSQAPPRIRAIPHVHKIAHLCLYCGWMALWGWLLSAGNRRVSRNALLGLCLGGAAWGAFDELTQAFIHGRSPGVIDWTFDLLGLLAGAVVVAWLDRRRTPAFVTQA